MMITPVSTFIDADLFLIGIVGIAVFSVLAYEIIDYYKFWSCCKA